MATPQTIMSSGLQLPTAQDVAGGLRLGEGVVGPVVGAEAVASRGVETRRGEPGRRRGVDRDEVRGQNEALKRALATQGEPAGGLDRGGAHAGQRHRGGATEHLARAGAGQRQHAAEVAGDRAVAPVLGGEEVPHVDREVAVRGPRARERERLRPQQAGVVVDAAGDRAVRAEVEVDDEGAAAEAVAARLEADSATEAARLGHGLELEGPQDGPAAGDDLHRQHAIVGAELSEVDVGCERDLLAGRQLGRLRDHSQGGTGGCQAVDERGGTVVAQDGGGVGLARRERGGPLLQHGDPAERARSDVHAFRGAAAVRVAHLARAAGSRAVAAGDADPQFAEAAGIAVGVDQARRTSVARVFGRQRSRRRSRRLRVRPRTGVVGRDVLLGDVAR
jgi:hypothetical protein